MFEKSLKEQNGAKKEEKMHFGLHNKTMEFVEFTLRSSFSDLAKIKINFPKNSNFDSNVS